MAAPLVSLPAGPLAGARSVPGDKSISHRALILGALAVGETTVRGLLESDDVLRTAAALRAFGVDVKRGGNGLWRVQGLGVGGLHEPATVLDLGNSGTAARLLMGVAGSHPFTSFFTGDESLRSRPMDRVVVPLERMGAQVTARSGRRLPLALSGADEMLPIEYRLPVASAQVKSAVLLAGLNAAGRTTVVESQPTRDHTERMLVHFGAEVTVERIEDGARAITVTGQPELAGQPVTVPGDPSAAAFPAVAALIAPGSDVTLTGVGMNELRAGLYRTLADMGADIEVVGRREADGEPVADLRCRGGRLNAIEVPPERAPTMIDEYPALAVAAACAEGTTVMRGLAELRVKESDRLAAVAQGLAACGVEVEEFEDGLAIQGRGGPPPGGGRVETRSDHRIAMAFLTLGIGAQKAVGIDDGTMIATSFPGFVELMNGLGARIVRSEGAP